ncbi:MAG: hypothetical protein WDW20_04370 [Neisseriaceae bacterium]
MFASNGGNGDNAGDFGKGVMEETVVTGAILMQVSLGKAVRPELAERRDMME